MTTIASKPVANVHPDREWQDPTPPTFECFLEHLSTLADCFRGLEAECREVRADLAAHIARGATISNDRMETVIRIASQIGGEDVENHPNPSEALRKLAAAGDDLYFDAVRLSGKTVWDATHGSWEPAGEVAQREAATRRSLDGAR